MEPEGASVQLEQLSLDQKDSGLIQISSGSFPVKTQAHSILLKEGQSLSLLKSSFSDRNFLLIGETFLPTHIFEIHRSKASNNSSDFVVDIRQLTGGDSAELFAAGKFLAQSIDLGGKPLTLALAFKDPENQLTPSFVRDIVEQVKSLGLF